MTNLPTLLSLAREKGSDSAFLDWIRRQESCLKGGYSEFFYGEGRCVPAHVRRAREAGTAYKPPYSAVPMTDAQHKLQSQKGEKACLEQYLGGKWTAEEAKTFFDAKCQEDRVLTTMDRGGVMSRFSHKPVPMRAWLSSLPSQNVGVLYATVKSPILGIEKEFRVEAWGQLCDGRDHIDLVHLHLYNHFPDRGKGWTYLSWRSEPDNAGANQHAREGKVAESKAYSGVAYD